MNRSRMLAITRTELRQLKESPDFWAPMLVLALLFFLVVPGFLLILLPQLPDQGVAASVSSALDLLPQQAQARVQGTNPIDRTSYALAVYLFAPIAVIVPMTISTAVGANCLVGEREKGTGEWLAQTPATEREIYLGKLLASLLPGYLTTLVGFALYSLLVNVVVGPRVGGWFFPTGDWWLLMFWVVPPFLALTLSVVLRLSGRVRSAAAAQQASGLVTLPLIMVSYAQLSGALFGTGSAVAFGSMAWLGAAWGLVRGQRAVRRSRLLGVD